MFFVVKAKVGRRGAVPNAELNFTRSYHLVLGPPGALEHLHPLD